VGAGPDLSGVSCAVVEDERDFNFFFFWKM
jgi:hypothetical protein